MPAQRSTDTDGGRWFGDTIKASRRSVDHLRDGLPSMVVAEVEERLGNAERSRDISSLLSVSAALALLEHSLKGDTQSEREAMDRLGISIQTV